MLLVVVNSVEVEDIHNSWLYCFTYPLEEDNQELCISSIQDVSPRGFSRDH